MEEVFVSFHVKFSTQRTVADVKYYNLHSLALSESKREQILAFLYHFS